MAGTGSAADVGAGDGTEAAGSGTAGGEAGGVIGSIESRGLIRRRAVASSAGGVGLAVTGGGDGGGVGGSAGPGAPAAGGVRGLSRSAGGVDSSLIEHRG